MMASGINEFEPERSPKSREGRKSSLGHQYRARARARPRLYYVLGGHDVESVL